MHACRLPFLSLLPAIQAASLILLRPAARIEGRYGDSQQVLGGSAPSNAEILAPADVNFFANRHGPHRRTGFVAFGDSYSAGIGTFVDGKENECRQEQRSLPLPHQRRPPGGRDRWRRLQLDQHDLFLPKWLSCTGSVIDDLLSGGSSSQIDTFNVSFGAPDASPDFATLSIGGNDLGFFDVMNACVFRFYSFYSGTCDRPSPYRTSRSTAQFELRLTLVMMEILDRSSGRSGRGSSSP